MRELFRVHGDNVVECDRFISYITRNAIIHSFSKAFSSLACLTVNLDFEYAGTRNTWAIEMFPGFSKDNRSQRWQSNIFDALKANGSFLDETPDVVVTKVEDGQETVLFAIEFCSALQAGNQAWQRSGRAYSIGRTTCPYIYIADFVKYEIESKTRERKTLRSPNPAVPFSYISFSKQTGGFAAQAYVKAEEFRAADKLFESFDNDWFPNGLLLENNFSVVTFLASSRSRTNSFSVEDWQAIFDTDANILEYSKAKVDGFNFAKKFAQKAQTEGGKIGKFSPLIRDLSVGVASKNLPFGLLPSAKISDFVGKLKVNYSPKNGHKLR